MILSLVLLALGATSALGQTGATITGSVTDAVTHRPVQGAWVVLPNGSHSTTGSDGTYIVKDLSSGEVPLRVVQEGYQDFDGKPVRLADGDVVTRNFELHPLARLKVRVVDRDTGQPLDARIFLCRKESVLGVTQWFLQPDSESQQNDLKPGDYILAVGGIRPTDTSKTSEVPAGYWNEAFYPGVSGLDMASTVHLGEGDQVSLEIRVPKIETHAASGTIEAPSGHELDQPGVWLQKGGLSVLPDKTPIHQFGPFRIDGLIPGTYGLAAKIGQGTVTEYGRVIFTVTDHDLDGLKITFQPGATVNAGLRMAEEGVPLPSTPTMEDEMKALIKAEQAGLPPPNLKPGEMPIIVSLVEVGGPGDIKGPWWASGPGCSSWACGPGSNLGGFPVVDGKVVDGRPGIVGGPHENIPQFDYWPEIGNLPDGYAVSRILFQNQDLGGRPLALYGSGELVFVITSRPGAITGTALDENQAPLPHAIIEVVPDSFTAASDPRQVRRSETGTRGEFSFRNLAPGKYRVILLGNSAAAEVHPQQTTVITIRP